jgi:hypothetical protein
MNISEFINGAVITRVKPVGADKSYIGDEILYLGCVGHNINIRKSGHEFDSCLPKGDWSDGWDYYKEIKEPETIKMSYMGLRDVPTQLASLTSGGGGSIGDLDIIKIPELYDSKMYSVDLYAGSSCEPFKSNIFGQSCKENKRRKQINLNFNY